MDAGLGRVKQLYKDGTMAKVDVGGAASQGLAGAGVGFGIGGAPGAAVGGLIGLTGGLFSGRKKKKKRSTLDKRQQQLNEQQAQGIQGQGPLADLYNYDPEKANNVFDKTIGNPAYRNFQENVIPGITGSFRKNGKEDSSYVANALGKAGRDVQEGLDAQRSKYLYDTENQARTSKQNAVENYQNRQTQATDVSNQGGFDIGKILDSIPKEAYGQIIQRLTGKAATAGVQ